MGLQGQCERERRGPAAASARSETMQREVLEPTYQAVNLKHQQTAFPKKQALKQNTSKLHYLNSKRKSKDTCQPQSHKAKPVIENIGASHKTTNSPLPNT
jgi:hypothetical protein